jgi:hypothetical protein
MSDIYYRDYRIEIRPCAIPGGWSAQIHIWNCYAGTTRMSKVIALPTHLAFSTIEGAHAHAEKVARQWVEDQVPAENQLPAEERRPPQAQALSRKRQRRRTLKLGVTKP